MIPLFSALKSDFQKQKHTPIFWIHIIIPIIGSFFFLVFYSLYGRLESFEKHATYFEFLGIIFPILIGLICGMIASQEEQAGEFQVLLSSTQSRNTTYLSKLLMLLFMGMLSVFLVLGLMLLGLKFIFHVSNIPYLLYLKAFGWLIFSNVFIYVFHLFISLQFSRGASILLGISGTLIAALMVTGLGDKCWTYLPWAWAVRFCEFTVLNSMSIEMHKQLPAFWYQSAEKATWFMIAITIISLILSLIWFKYWEGRKSYE